MDNVPQEILEAMGLMKWVPLVCFPFMTFLPAGVHFYFIALNFFNLGLSVLFGSKLMKGLVGASLLKQRGVVEGQLAEVFSSPLLRTNKPVPEKSPETQPTEEFRPELGETEASNFDKVPEPEFSIKNEQKDSEKK